MRRKETCYEYTIQLCTKPKRPILNLIKFILIMTGMIVGTIIVMILLTFPQDKGYDIRYHSQASTITASMVTTVTTVTSSESVITTTTVITSSEDQTLEDQIGNYIINIDNSTLIKQELPSKYYDINFSKFIPFMDYRYITAEDTPAYKVSNSWKAYTDEYGLRRSIPDEDQFNLGIDDYVVAMGTFYKEKGTCGSRFLIVTTTGMFTVITGDEKADEHTEDLNMGTIHIDEEGENTYLAILEWLVDEDQLLDEIAISGNVKSAPIEALQGDIEAIYRIE